jgi:hypothetical protein
MIASASRRRAVRRLAAVVGGAMIGLAVGLAIVAICQPRRRDDLPTVPLREDTGQIARVVMHYHPDVGAAVARGTTYRDNSGGRSRGWTTSQPTAPSTT